MSEAKNEEKEKKTLTKKKGKGEEKKKKKEEEEEEEEDEPIPNDVHLKIRPINLVYVSPNPWDYSNDVVIMSSKKNQQILWDKVYKMLDTHGKHYAHEGGMYLIYAILDYIVCTERKNYETNEKVVNALLGSLTESEFVKVMQLNTTKAKIKSADQVAQKVSFLAVP